MRPFEISEFTAIVESTHDYEGLPFKVYFLVYSETGEPLQAYAFPGEIPIFNEEEKESPIFKYRRTSEFKAVCVYSDPEEIAREIRKFAAVVTNDDPYPSEAVKMFEQKYFGGYE